MNGTSVIGGGLLNNPGASWHLKGTGDFNGDGLSDLLWQNDDGTVAVWDMNGTSLIGGGIVANPGTGWHAKGTGDYNGDGKSDILLQNDDGSVAVWTMNGASLTGGGIVTSPGAGWHVVGTDNMRFISGATGNGTLAGTPGQSDTFVFTSYAAGSHAIGGFNTAQDLIEFSKGIFANFAAVQSHSSASGTDTLIALGGGSTLLIQGVTPGALTAGDFKFV